MNKIRFFLTLAIIALLATAALAQNPVGKWNGRMEVDQKKMSAQSPEAKKMMEQLVEMMGKMRFALELKADKTFTIKVTGVDPSGKKQEENVSGTWTQSGAVLTLTDKPKTANQKPQPQKLTLSKDGKKLTLSPPGAGEEIQLVFTRG
jgi:hypothetical protein